MATVTDERLKRLNWTMHDAVVDGEVLRDLPSKMVYVTDADELAAFAGDPPGTIAALYGFSKLWQLQPDGTWLMFVGTEDDD